MSQNNSNQTPSRTRPESQAERWIKYGSNVGLTIVLAIVLAVILTWVAQRARARVDTTKGGSLSLKPQSIEVLKQLKQHVTLVSLYVHTDQNRQASADEDAPKIEPIDFATKVSDLLDEYRSKSTMIDVKVIDPLKEKDKLEDLHKQFINKYGGQIKGYTDYLNDWKAQANQIQKLLAAEADQLRPFSTTEEATSEKGQFVDQVVRTVSQSLPEAWKNASDDIDRELKHTHPDYKSAVEVARKMLDRMSTIANTIATQAPIAQNEASIPAAFRKYLMDAVPRYQQIKKLCDDMVSRADKLGELKVDQLEQALNVDNPVLVLGDNEWRVLSFGQVWQQDPDAKALANGAAIRPRFAGEQAITTAIYTLESPTKQKICILRPGGAPLANPGFMGLTEGGPLSTFANYLREYNFDVTEKDLSGQWQMQAQMRQQMPSAPEPSDEEIKDAVWVVLDAGGEQGPPTGVAAKLAEHLKQGGSALVLVEPHGDPLVEALKDWGVEVHPQAVSVHQPVVMNDTAGNDPIEEAKARPYIFDVRNYGNHPIARPELNLDSIFVPIVPVSPGTAQGAQVTALLPLSESVSGLKTWGETDIDSLARNETPTFNPEKGDIPGPLFGGAAVEKGKGRLVVIGSARFVFNNFLHIPDPNVQRTRNMLVARFPGNLELATNSVFWVAKLDPMIAISPSAMDVSRISGDMSPGMLKFWRIGVMMVLLPGLVIAAGLGVYAARKD
ncbi:MAG TPA: hypothetical protein VH370_09395 [Humisphaera sp.]|jgi:hypothetical protein|nr:hypothetical protein [Humisphaera sp.]